MWHLFADMCVGAALLAFGILIGGTAAWYKGWDEGFREGYGVEINKRTGGDPLPVLSTKRNVARMWQDRRL